MARSLPPDNRKTEIAARLARRIDELIQQGNAKNVHSVVALHHGELLFEWYGSGLDFKWAEPLGHVTFERDTLHDIRSVTKSIVGLLYGIALANGDVPPPDAALMPHFPQYPDLANDPARSALTVHHALTMTLGLQWNEDAPYDSLENSEIAMEFADDRYRYILEQPIVARPGATWRYSGGATALLGYLIERGTGKTLPDFARESLFQPLGIDAFVWMAGDDGVASAASGLRLKPIDLARIGQLTLEAGRWKGQEIIPSEWLDQSLVPHVEIAPGFLYGYHWYGGSLPLETHEANEHDDVDREGQVKKVDPSAAPAHYNWYGAIGNGDQRLWVLPELQLVVVMTAGNYNDWSDRAMPGRILRAVVKEVVSE